MSAYNMAMAPVCTNPWAQAQFDPTVHGHYSGQQLFYPQTQAQYGVDERFALNEPPQYERYIADATWDSWSNGDDNTVPDISPLTAAWGGANSTPDSRSSPSPSFYPPEPPLSATPFFESFPTPGFGAFNEQNLGGYTAPFPFHDPDPVPAGFPAWTNSGSPSNSPGFYEPQSFNGASPCDIFETSPYGYPQGASDAGQFYFDRPACLATLQETAISWPNMVFDSVGHKDDGMGMCDTQDPQHAQAFSTYPYLVEEPYTNPSSPPEWSFSLPQNTCLRSSPVAYSPVETTRPLKRSSDSDDGGVEERPSKRVKTKGSESGTSEERKKSEQTKTSRRAARTHVAGQMLPAAFQGDGDGTRARQQVEHQSSRTHVLENTTSKSGATEQAGASNEKMRERQRLRVEEKNCPTETSLTRLREKRIIEGAIGKPAPDLQVLTFGLHTLKYVQDEVTKRQICLRRSKGKGCCGQVIGGSHNSREIHYSTKHARRYRPLGQGKDKRAVWCPQPGCGDKIVRQGLDHHLRQNKKYLLADLRFLRLVCPEEDCPMGSNLFVPGSRWYHHQMNQYKQSTCLYKGSEYCWKVVDEEPNMDDYPILARS